VSGPPLGLNGMAVLPGWAELEAAVPQVAATMRRYLTQISCVLRPGSVGGADLALRSFAAFLAEAAPEVAAIAQVSRRHIEDYKPWLAARPGQNKPRLTPATMIHRLGTLRMFFVRLDEWGWDEAPPKVPMFTGDLPRTDHPLPKALDDASAAKLLRAAQNDKRLLVRVTVEVLLRTGLRVSEFTGLQASAVVHIGAGPWLHVPVGKLREDRYLPLHPQLLALIDDYRARHVPAGHPLLLPRENGRPLDRHAVTRMINRAGAAAALPHIHPHQLRHTLATQAKGRGVASDATFREKREHPRPGLQLPRPSQRAGRVREQSGDDLRCQHPGFIKPDDVAATSVASSDPHDAADATEKRSDEEGCHYRPLVRLRHSAGLVNRSLPVAGPVAGASEHLHGGHADRSAVLPRPR
jgi:site-specific recombinase XerD